MSSSRFPAVAFIAALALAGPAVQAAQDPAVHSSKEEGVTLPSVVSQVKPDYTREGMRLGIQGTVVLSSVVRADGSVDDVAVVTSLDESSGLDQAAVDAMKQWRFNPGTKNGQAVAVRIECEMRFALK